MVNGASYPVGVSNIPFASYIRYTRYNITRIEECTYEQWSERRCCSWFGNVTKIRNAVRMLVQNRVKEYLEVS